MASEADGPMGASVSQISDSHAPAGVTTSAVGQGGEAGALEVVGEQGGQLVGGSACGEGGQYGSKSAPASA